MEEVHHTTELTRSSYWEKGLEKLDKKERAIHEANERNVYRAKLKERKAYEAKLKKKAEGHQARHDEVLNMSIQELLVELLLLLENRGANVNIKGGYRGSR